MSRLFAWLASLFDPVEKIQDERTYGDWPRVPSFLLDREERQAATAQSPSPEIMKNVHHEDNGP